MEKLLNKEITTLYKEWPKIRSFMKLHSCDEGTAEDLFQEALLVYLRKRREGLELDVDAFFYVKKTCYFLWMNQAKKKKNYRETELAFDISSEEETFLEKEEKISEIEKSIAFIGEKCQQLLNFFYVDKLSMQQIAEKLNLDNEKATKAQKYRCIQKLKEKVDGTGMLNPQISEL